MEILIWVQLDGQPLIGKQPLDGIAGGNGPCSSLCPLEKD